MPTPKLGSLGCGPTTVGVNQTVTCRPSVSGEATSFAWSALGGNPGSGSDLLYSTSFAMPGAKQITLEVCNGPSCDSGTALVTVLVPPDPSFNCEPLTAGVDDLVSCIALDGNATSYSWSTLGGMPASGMERSFSTRHALAGSKTISLEVCNAVECRSFSQGITVADPISATINCSPSPALVGQTVVCSPTILEGGPAVSYNWQASDQFEPILGDANPDSGDQSAFVTAFSFAGTKLITLSVCNASSCAAAFTTVLVGSASPPVFEAFSCNPTTAKFNQPIQCDALVFNTLPGATYSFSAPSASPPGGSGTLTAEQATVQFVIQYGTFGTFTVTFTACNGPACDSRTESIHIPG